MNTQNKIIILSPIYGDPQTGGQKYNFILYDILDSNYTNIITDKHFKIHNSFILNFEYLKILLKSHPKILIFDSRMYTRLFIAITILKILNPKITIICTHHHFNFIARENKLISLFDRILEIYTLKRCNKIFIPSKYTLSVSKKYLDKDKLKLIPIGFNKNFEYNVQKKTTDNKRFLFVGNIYPRKGIHLLLKTIHLIKRKDIYFDIVGSYTDNKYYRMLSRYVTKNNLNDKVIFHGRLNNMELNNKFINAYAFIMPSLYEGFGMVVAEAFSYGLPVIAFNNSALPYLVKNNFNGILVNNKDTFELKNAIERIIDDKPLYDSMTYAAISSFKKLISIEEQKAVMMKEIKSYIK